MSTPHTPYENSVTWYEAGPEPITADEDRAVLMIRVGIALDALSVQHRAGVQSGDRAQSHLASGVAFALINSAALTFEAVQLARANMAVLRPLAVASSVDEEVLVQIGKLGSGQHPASPVLHRCRNKIGFHWDDDVLRRSLREFTSHSSLVWLELDTDSHPLYRLANDVLSHAMLSATGTPLSDDTELARGEIGAQLETVSDAFEVVLRFLTASFRGHLVEHVKPTRVTRS